MLQGRQVDTLVVLLTGAVLALGLVLVFRAKPRWAVLAWVLTIAFVPYWLGVRVGVYLPPATAMAGLAVVALIGRRQLRLHVPDLVVATVVLLAVISAGVGFVTIHALFVVVMDWGLAYLLARTLSASVELEWIYGAVAAVLGVAAAVAVVEFVSGTNVFVGIGPAGGLHANWSGLQERGGILRAEGAFGHSIALGASLALAVPLALGSRLRSRTKVALVVVLLAGALVSFSRVGIGTAVLGLVLSLLLLGNDLRPKVRLLLSAALATATVVALPFVDGVFTAAGEEATNSAAYRGDLVALIPTMRFLGTATSAQRSADGVLSFGGFESIDSAFIYAGLTYGWLVMALFAGMYVAAVIGMLRAPTAPLIAVVAQLPAILSVAFITQYSAMFWFVVGLAVSAYAVRVVAAPPRALTGVRAQPTPRLDQTPEPVRTGPGTRQGHLPEEM